MTFHIYTLTEFALAVCIVLAGGLVRGLTGFGSGLVMVPLLSLLWGPVEAIATMAGLGMFNLAQLAPDALRRGNLREVTPMLVGAAALTPVGLALLVSLDPALLKKIIAALILAITALSLAGWTYRGPRGMVPAFVAGGLTGFVNGIAGVGGPATVLYIMSLPSKAETQRANIVLAMGLSTLLTTGGLLVAGEIGIRVLTHVLVFLAPSIAGTWAGAKLFYIMPGRMFRLIVLIFLAVISVGMLLT